MAGLDSAVTDYAAGLLLRYFRSVAPVPVDRPIVQIERDRELLRLHWALSGSVSELVAYLFEHRHEIQTALTSAPRLEDATVRGRIDAAATLLRRRVSGLSTAVVSHEPLRSHASGPNHVLGWVLAQAAGLSMHFATLTDASPGYSALVHNAIHRLTAARKIQGIAQIAAQVGNGRRPGAGALREASRARRGLYRKAADAYRSLLLLEAGDEVTVTALLRSTLLGPLESWRRFELAAGLAAADALAQASHAPLRLNLLVGDTRRPLAEVGRFAIFWQWQTSHYQAPPPEPSEAVTRDILDAYGLSSAGDRPDLVVVDRDTNAVVAIIEVKYLTGDDASDRLRAAAAQIVRYSRGYAPLEQGTALRGRSLLVVSQGLVGLTVPQDPPPGVPFVADFEGLTRDALTPWAQRLLH